MLIQETRRGHNCASATPLLRWFRGRRRICLGAFRSVDKCFILAHPFTIPSDRLCGFCSTQLLSQPFTTTTMLQLYITCKAHYKLAIFIRKWCGVS